MPLYVKALQAQHMGGDDQTRRMDEALPEPTILLFRRLAHAQVCIRWHLLQLAQQLLMSMSTRWTSTGQLARC